MTRSSLPRERGRSRVRRPLAGLLVAWALTLAAEWCVHWLVTRQPFLSDLARPLYVPVLVPALIVTWRSLRPRSGRERRAGDRRHAERRDDPASEQQPAQPSRLDPPASRNF